MTAKATIKRLLATADVRVNGSRPGDIQVHNPKTFQRILADGSLGLGESYMKGWWDCDRIDVFFEKILGANLENQVKGSWAYILDAVKAKLLNLQSKIRAFQVGEKHYDNGNELYKYMLGKRMVYTCGYWKGLKRVPKNLDKAQEQKLDLVCKKIGLKKGMTVLDIGCGWGSFAKFAAEKYKVKVVGITISKEQVKFARKLCKDLPVKIRLQDYRDVREKFDRIVSLGMIEHVGWKNHREYMKVVHRCLKKDGLFLLHTIGSKSSEPTVEPWLNKYIFPNGDLPSMKQLTQAAEGLLVLEDFHSFGMDYDPTLMAWNHNFVKNWDKIKEKGNEKYNERFFRMWSYYLQMCAGSFRIRRNKLWQLVFSKKALNDYTGVR